MKSFDHDLGLTKLRVDNKLVYFYARKISYNILVVVCFLEGGFDNKLVYFYARKISYII